MARMLSRIRNLFRPQVTAADDGGAPSPRVVPRGEHGITPSRISPAARRVLEGLHEAGFRACLVGGGVRDLLLGREPKDFDVTTDATPEQVRKLFRSARIIGRRFRIVHVRFGREIVEVATFRANDPDAVNTDADGRIISDNVYGTIETDALRRDFTVNALYYDHADGSVLDFAGGMADLEAGRLRLIGDPDVRFREDPVRMLRAVRFAAKLGFVIEPAVQEAIFRQAPMLEGIAPARLFEEVLKMFHAGYAVETFEQLRHYGLFRYLFPMTDALLEEEEQGFPHMFAIRALENTDRRINAGKPVTPAFLFAVLLWEPLRARAQALQEEGLPEAQALQAAASEVIAEQSRHISIPRRFSLPMREIWLLQARLRQTRGKRPFRTLEQPRFRAAYDFLCLRAQAGEQELEPLCQWWTRFQEVDEAERERMTRGAGGGRKRSRRRRPRKRRGGTRKPAES